MRRSTLAFAALGMTTMISSVAWGVTSKDFAATTTTQLAQLCATKPSDPAYAQAQQFCNGFISGAFAYRRAVTRPGSPPQYCNLPANRVDGAAGFSKWADAHPQYANDNPANSLFRYLDENFRCHA